MYLSHYNLDTKPFQMSTDPEFLWLGEKHKEALAMLKYAIYESKGILALTGDVGTGKTTLINALIASLGDDTIAVTIYDPSFEILEFFNMVAAAFYMDKAFDSKGDFFIHLRQFLKKARGRNQKVLLIVDEAQRINAELLEEIRLLSNLEDEHIRLLNIFFVGQNEFADILNEVRNRALRQRISIRCHIEPLTLSEAEAYTRHRLKIAGAKARIFSSGAIQEIYSFSNGYPRLINIICDHALSAGYVKGVKTIDAKTIKECADGLRISTQRIDDNKEQEVLEKSNEIEEEPAIKSSGRTLKPILLLAIAVIVFSFIYYQGKFGKRIDNIKKDFGNGSSNQQKLAPIDMPQIGDTDKKMYPVVKDSQEPQKTSSKLQQIDSNAANLTSESKMPDEKKQADQKLLSLPHIEKTKLEQIDSNAAHLTSESKMPDEKKQADQKLLSLPHIEKTKLEQIDSNAAHLTSEAKMPDEKKQADQKLLSLPHIEKTKLAMDQDRLQAGRYTVYLHYLSKENKELIEGLAVSLKNKGFKVLGIERVNYKVSDIRYFHNGDKAGALLLQKYSTEFITLNTNLKNANIRIKDLSKRFPNVRKGALELWVNQ